MSTLTKFFCMMFLFLCGGVHAMNFGTGCESLAQALRNVFPIRIHKRDEKLITVVRNDDNREIEPTEEVKKLLEAGARATYANSCGITALMHSADNGYLRVASMLLWAQADVNHACNRGQTALMRAAVSGHTDMIKLLIRHGADLYKAAYCDENPFALEAMLGGTALIQVADDDSHEYMRAGVQEIEVEAKKKSIRVVSELLVGKMLSIPDEAQKQRVYASLICMKRIFGNGIFHDLRFVLKDFLRAIIRQENEPKVLEEINKILNNPMREYLLNTFFGNRWRIVHE